MANSASATSYAIVRGSPTQARGSCLARLRTIQIPSKVDAEGRVVGLIAIPAATLPMIDGVSVGASARFSCADGRHVVFDPPSPLARLEPIAIDDLETGEQLTQRVVDAWQQLAIETEAALTRARVLSPNTRLRLDPFRLEGTVRYGRDVLLLLFATKGHRACISGIGDRLVVFKPEEPRIILPSSHGRPTAQDDLWDRAIEQAKACLAPEPPTTVEERELSVDLASRDLASLDLSSDDLP